MKIKAVELSNEKSNITELARELGIRVAMLYKWRKDYDKFVAGSFPGKGILKQTPEQKTISALEAKVKEVERVYLTESEIQSIIEKDFKTEKLSLVRDIFLFSCFTGLAYIDIKNLTKSHIKKITGTVFRKKHVCFSTCVRPDPGNGELLK